MPTYAHTRTCSHACTQTYTQRHTQHTHTLVNAENRDLRQRKDDGGMRVWGKGINMENITDRKKISVFLKSHTI